jgi:hypothetical protein
MATTRPNQSVDAFESNGTYFVSVGTSASAHTFYLNQHDAIELLLKLTTALQGTESEDYLSLQASISLYQKTLTNA